MFRLLPLLLLLLSFSSGAQSVPGYLGHRFMISYEPHLFPSFKNPNSASYDPESSGISLNFQHHLRFDWMASKKVSLGIDAGIYRTHMHLNDFYFSGLESEPMILPLNGHSIAGVFRWHQRHFAPLGKFFEMKLGAVGYKPATLIYESSTQNLEVQSELDYSPYIGMCFGLNHVFFDRMLFTIGADINYVFGGFKTANTLFTDPELSWEHLNSSNAKETLKNISKGRVFTHYLFNFKIGIGYLL